MKNRGQALIICLVALPLLLALFGLIARTGGQALAHDRIENHCDKKILDALKIQGDALHMLGLINPTARGVINARRAIDPLVEAGVVYLKPAQTALKLAQQVIDKSQKAIKMKAIIESRMELSKPAPRDFGGRIHESYTPHNPKLYVEPEQLYRQETGAPLQPDDEFSEKQMASGTIKIFTEKFLLPWPKMKAVGDMDLHCKAKITMDQLEEKWQAQLVAPADKL